MMVKEWRRLRPPLKPQKRRNIKRLCEHETELPVLYHALSNVFERTADDTRSFLSYFHVAFKRSGRT